LHKQPAVKAEPLRGLTAAARALAVAIASTMVACSGQTASSGLSSAPAIPVAALQHRGETTTPIKHVIIIFQENRSFDNIFAGFSGADAPTFGFAQGGKKIPLQPVGLTRATSIIITTTESTTMTAARWMGSNRTGTIPDRRYRTAT